MLSSYWKPISIAIVFSIIVSIHGRPNVRYAQDLKQDRAADSAQMRNLKLLHGANYTGESILTNLIYNVSQIPVQVIYDPEDTLAKRSFKSNQAPVQTALNVARNVDGNAENQNIAQLYYLHIDEGAPPIHGPSQRAKNPVAALILTRLIDFLNTNNFSAIKLPTVYQFKSKDNTTIVEQIDHKYPILLLESLKQPNVEKKNVPVRKYPDINIFSPYSRDVFMPPYPYPMPQYYPWTPPYYPAIPTKYYNDIGLPFFCPQHQFRMARQMTNTNQNEDVEEEKQQQPQTEVGKRRYDEDPYIEYVDSARAKMMTVERKKPTPTYMFSEMRRRHTTNQQKETEHEQRVAEIGPQISKLVVRRGGVAIAGPGGIATAGSGGTAIVGPGGTAFTTPASSGGVAMVGPGAKVIKVPDITNVLYGRTSSVAATGAGHVTFTNKDREVFTTGDHTGGMALVNPDGDFVGLSDSIYALNTSRVDAKEVQVPAGARLLTTGPIIYYNPVYPNNQIR